MAIIGKIREKSGLVATFVGIGLLAFIIPFNDLARQFSGEANSSIGLFNNSEIDANEWNYNNKYIIAQNNLRYNNMNSGGSGTISSQDEDQLRQNTWNQMISDTIYFLELDKIGLSVSADELNQGLLNGENPLPSSLKDLFVKNGVYNKDSFNIWKTNRIINLPDNEDSKKDLKNNIENPLKNERSMNKYSSMVKYGFVNTVQESKRALSEDNCIAEVKYIFLNYDKIPDSLISMTNEARKDYFNEHRYEKIWQKNQELRSYDYSILTFKPSASDVLKSSKRMEDLKEDFKNSKNDSLFVANYSETPIIISSPYGDRPSGNFSNNPYRGGKFSSIIDQKIENSKQGDVIGPFTNGNKLQLVKIFSTGDQEQAKVRHILINSKSGDINESKNKSLADSILYAVRRDSSKFTMLAKKYSDDPGSASNGGVYNWFPKGQMVPEFEKFSFNKKVGSSGVVKTNYGYHVIQVLGRKVGSFKKIAVVDETIQISKTTKNQFYDSVALAFYYKADSFSFETAAEDLGFEVKSSGYVPLMFPNRRTNGLYGPQEFNRNLNIAKWAFNSDIGDIMEPEYIADNKLVIAVLREKILEDDDRFNNLKTIMEPLVKNHLKFNYFSERYSDISDFDSLSILMNSETKNAKVKYSDVNIGNNIKDIAEPKVIAQIFKLSNTEISPVIEGKKGIYILQKINSKYNNEISDKKIFNNTIERQKEIRKQIEQNYYPSLYNAYNVKDLRARNMIMNN